MKKLILFLFFISLSLMSFAKEPVEGRWDITITKAPGKTSPSWLEITHSGIRTLTGHFVGEGGSARPVSKINFQDNKISFQIPPQWEDADQDLKVEGIYANDQLVGTLTTPKGETYTWVGVRAPALWREKAPVWGKPIELFNGKDLTGWEAINKKNQWIVENGVLKSPKSGANLRTKDTYNDFKLHIEFRYPKESNSGIYLRGRYELQVSDSQGMEVAKDQLGAIYGFILPLENIAKAAGEWQSFDITLVGRLVTVIGNGKQIIYTQSIPGITGGAMDSHEGEPGPIMIQGDHGPVEYRNIVLTPAL
jgi:hypothetical protein